MPRTRSELTGIVDTYGNVKGIFERRLLTNVSTPGLQRAHVCPIFARSIPALESLAHIVLLLLSPGAFCAADPIGSVGARKPHQAGPRQQAWSALADWLPPQEAGVQLSLPAARAHLPQLGEQGAVGEGCF